MKPGDGLIDTHVHLDRLPGPASADAQAAEASEEAGVAAFIVPGVTANGWEGLLHIAGRIPGARPAPGLHPAAAGQWDDRSRARLAALLRDPAVVAVGEIGLDDHPGMPARALQERTFREQLQLAVARGKPVLLHCRRATGRLLKILAEEQVEQVGGIFHAFSGSIETAREILRLNLAVGIGGPVTYPNARRLPEVLRQLPAEGFVLETDAPDLAPHPFRHQPNRPVRLGLIAAKIAEILGWSRERTARVTSANARRVLHL